MVDSNNKIFSTMRFFFFYISLILHTTQQHPVVLQQSSLGELKNYVCMLWKSKLLSWLLITTYECHHIQNRRFSAYYQTCYTSSVNDIIYMRHHQDDTKAWMGLNRHARYRTSIYNKYTSSLLKNSVRHKLVQVGEIPVWGHVYVYMYECSLAAVTGLWVSFM